MLMNYIFPESEQFFDNTPELLKRANQQNVHLRQGSGYRQHEILNMALEELSDMDLVFISDADEFILDKDQKEIIQRMKNFDIGLISYIDYFSVVSRYVGRDHHPIVIVKPNVRFYEVRCASGKSTTWDDISMHHFGFMLPDDKKRWKVNKQNKTGGNFGDLCGRAIIRTEMPDELRSICTAQ